MILQKLKSDAEHYLGEDVTDAVITVPAYFDDAQRNATKAAGEIAGLNVRRIINEPTAAALAYGMDTAIAQSDQPAAPMHLAVYDLGGGTFDISILRLDSGVVDVVATSGDAFLGGDDFDALIVEHLLDDFRRDTGIDLAADPAALTRVKEAAETAKRELSTTQTARVNLPYISANQDGPKHLECELTRDQLDDWANDLVQATIEPCERALSDAQLSPSDIDQVALIGGQTRMPLVQEVVRRYFGREPSRSVNPDEVVAVGAALQGGIMGGDVEQALLLLDVTSQTLGTSTIGDVFSPIIERNTSIPTSQSESYVTVRGQSDRHADRYSARRIADRFRESRAGRLHAQWVAPSAGRRGQRRSHLLARRRRHPQRPRLRRRHRRGSRNHPRGRRRPDWRADRADDAKGRAPPPGIRAGPLDRLAAALVSR